MFTNIYQGFEISSDMTKNFFIKSKNKDEAYKELREYAEKNPNNWIWIQDVGFEMDKPDVICRYFIEVNSFSDNPPHPSTMIFFSLYQRGNTPHAERTPEMTEKQMRFFHLLGSQFG